MTTPDRSLHLPPRRYRPGRRWRAPHRAKSLRDEKRRGEVKARERNDQNAQEKGQPNAASGEHGAPPISRVRGATGKRTSKGAKGATLALKRPRPRSTRVDSSRESSSRQPRRASKQKRHRMGYRLSTGQKPQVVHPARNRIPVLITGIPRYRVKSGLHLEPTPAAYQASRPVENLKPYVRRMLELEADLGAWVEGIGSSSQQPSAKARRLSLWDVSPAGSSSLVSQLVGNAPISPQSALAEDRNQWLARSKNPRTTSSTHRRQSTTCLPSRESEEPHVEEYGARERRGNPTGRTCIRQAFRREALRARNGEFASAA